MSTKKPREFGTLLVMLLIACAVYVAGVGYFLYRPPGLIMTGIFVLLCIGATFAALVKFEKKYPAVLSFFGTALAIYLVAYLPARALFSTTIEFTITGTETKRYGNVDQFLIFTNYGAKKKGAPGETFKNVDSSQFWKFNSSDVQGQAKDLTHRRVRSRVIGVRVQYASAYRNVIWIDPVEESAPEETPSAEPPAESPEEIRRSENN